MLEDARFALRTLVKRKGATLLLVSTLALGLAANAVIFNVLDAVVLRAFSFPNQERLVRVHETSRDFNGIDLSNVAPANLLDWQAQTRDVFSDLVGLQWWDASLRGREAAERIQGYRVGPSFFEALGVAPSAGRGFLAEEAREGRQRVAVLGHALWQRLYGGEPVVGKTITIDTEPYVVVGVAPPAFQFPEGAEVWAPLVLPEPAKAARDKHYLSVMGRLAPGRTRAEAQAALAVVAARLERGAPEDEHRARRLGADVPHGLRRPRAAADPGDLAGGRGARAADRVHQRREPDPRAVGRARPRAVAAHRARGRAGAGRAPAAHRRRPARGRRRRARDAARRARRPRPAREHARGDRALRARLGPARRRLAEPALQRARRRRRGVHVQRDPGLARGAARPQPGAARGRPLRDRGRPAAGRPQPPGGGAAHRRAGAARRRRRRGPQRAGARSTARRATSRRGSWRSR